MPNIDVSDLLLDEDIASEAFSVIRRQEVIGDNGVATIQTVTLPRPGDPPIVGAIFPTGDNSLVREEAYQTQSNTVTVITPFRLRGASKDGGNSFQPDIVVCSAGQFIVRSLNEWTKFGAGFVEAECIAYDFNPSAPT